MAVLDVAATAGSVAVGVPAGWRASPMPVVLALALVLVQAGLIVLLLRERRRFTGAQRTLRQLNQRLMSAQETERARIARELHDGVNQQLALLAIGLDALRARQGGPGRDPVLDELAQQLQGLAADVRRLAGDLHPARLERLGFAGAVRAMVHEFRTRHRILATGHIAADFPAELPPDVSLALYRTVQEALQNIARHSGARAARVVAERGPATLRVVIEDDGTGLDGSRRQGLGLVGIAERAAALDGACRVEAVVPHGVRLVVELPWPARVAAPTPVRGVPVAVPAAQSDRVTRADP